MLSKYRIVLCEIYNGYIHGCQDLMINSHYLIIGKFNLYYDCYYSDEDSDDSEDEDYDRDSLPIEEIMELHKEKYRSQFIRTIVRYKHPFIRNYREIVLRDEYIKPEIAECILLSSGETVAILKTFWIRIIQRVWKRVFLKRVNIMKKRCKK